jgi:hypothetical protein
MKKHYDFGKMTGERNPYVKALKQPITPKIAARFGASLVVPAKSLSRAAVALDQPASGLAMA